MRASRKYDCEVEWCTNQGYAKGLCKSHYYYQKKTGRIAPKPDVDGRRDHPLYGSWAGMISRCHNPNHSSYPRYGGRGIYVCDRWREDFRNFLADMGERPEGKTIDRYPDPLGPYSPANCRWATTVEQRQNISPDGDRRMREAMSVGTKESWRRWREEGEERRQRRPIQATIIMCVSAEHTIGASIEDVYAAGYAADVDDEITIRRVLRKLLRSGKLKEHVEKYYSPEAYELVASPSYLRRAASALE